MSNGSLITSAECGKHKEEILALKQSVEAMQEELRTKDRLVSKLLESEEDEQASARARNIVL